METAPLKSFATWARTALIREVTARIAVVLGPASPERVEQPKAVAALEQAVNTAGGGDKGRSAVADRVAYTWFNRIIALRFMDSNGCTGIGVVSPPVGVGAGQPEILAEAKRGNIDSEVVSQKTRDAITGLLNGTRRSDDPQGEAYALLLTEYCRRWNRAMPFMFEREGDFTELLIPANLLADDSVLNRAVHVLTKDVCQDVEVIGWLYQFYISERKAEVFAGIKKGRKVDASGIPAATELFTPHWIVRYLVENSLGRLWMLNRPTSRLVDQMEYYIEPVDEETDFLRITSPEELTVIDPACGSGHMLTYAFDLLYAMYEEEGYSPSEIPGLILTNNLYGTEIDPRAGALAAFAVTMKARAKQRTFFSKRVEPNICAIEPISFRPDELDFLVTPGGDGLAEVVFWNQFTKAETLGSLIRPNDAVTARLARHLETLHDGGDLLKADVIERAKRVLAQAEYLTRRYSVMVANPPYMGSRNMQASLKLELEKAYPDGKSDLYAAFIFRGLDLLDSGGVLAMITMQSWMFLKSYENLRRHILSSGRISSMLHLGARAFQTIGGEVVSTTTFTISKGPNHNRGVFVRLVDLSSQLTKSDGAKHAIGLRSASPRVHYLSGIDFDHFPGSIIAYWLPKSLRDLFVKCKALREIADPRKGLDTGNNDRFIRYWWEVGSQHSSYDRTDLKSAEESGAKWFPYNKGGDSRKWYGNHLFVVNWAHNGLEIREFGTEAGGTPRSAIRNPSYYFSPSISWSDVGGLAFRSYPQGFIHDNKGPSVFSADARITASLLAYLNSPLAAELLSAIAPTMSTQVGDVAILPARQADTFTDLTNTLVEVSRSDWDSFETSWNFKAFPLVCGVREAALSALVAEHLRRWEQFSRKQQALESKSNELVAALYGVMGEIDTEVTLDRVSLGRNAAFIYGPGLSEGECSKRSTCELIKELISYAVGCMFGRYSLDEPGLILADRSTTLQDYLTKVPAPTFTPDADNVLPVVDGDWFEDDIVAGFRRFLRVAFGEQHFEENLRFVADSLGVKDIRDYFLKSFYKDHVQRYKKRPIYWLFSSPKGSFNALIYMHRYTPSTVSTVLNEYLREFNAKLESSLQHQERLAAGGGTSRQQAAAQKEADRLRKVLLELDEYEHDVLYPLASQQISIDLDDGVKVNYPKFGAALKKIPGLEASE
ncbi:hypothetical protein MKUB_45850 [Mycobacterium kubicae]|uniref:site-specific DNA-methyltransferase (adenine-specific) n=1 Tax=Mycobacterium kubicae TaxID=120959 RepID=A0AAX1J916_9MYCO|nr:BREX-1 system adenine-specific DNA-methyltransferase PglX [Mycobacterium kubicae]MCV7097362.1 BREX-1 system adenine-specific DNA-methyltransferase PglX [Mycobacterium kubicae]ORW00434.1 restriction endonuclease [Mycobacterium kubicae]QNI13361.1 BREX-1 system adenine-specific DNA-methyltransferase PglX [Mycobacterium kubicae]QPI36884.1 BREX-1 system adenine-specific DNA-methyltransferase PglX [Mycobacterium kubicae]GFG67095.1 hypothetical protein MKUB_45850 [Mycobacterium kubicae]